MSYFVTSLMNAEFPCPGVYLGTFYIVHAGPVCVDHHLPQLMHFVHENDGNERCREHILASLQPEENGCRDQDLLPW